MSESSDLEIARKRDLKISPRIYTDRRSIFGFHSFLNE